MEEKYSWKPALQLMTVETDLSLNDEKASCLN